MYRDSRRPVLDDMLQQLRAMVAQHQHTAERGGPFEERG